MHFCDGRFPRTLIANVPGGCWYDEGRPTIHVEDTAQMRDVFLSTADVCRESVDAVLAATGKTTDAVDFFSMYQGTPWLRSVVQQHVGLSNARSIDTFAETGYLFAALLPTGMYYVQERGLLRDDDLVMVTGGGTGMTYGSMLLRWGR